MERKERTLLITLIANIVLIALRFFLAAVSGSIGLAANAWHSFADVFVSAVVFLGLFISRIGAAKLKRTVGKIENILALFVSVFIFYMGIEILFEALNNEGTELRYVPFVAAGAFIGIIINYFMARYKIYVGEATGSQSLVADGYHSKMDMYCSIAVLIGLLGSLFGMNSLDKISAIIAMVLIILAGYEIFITNLRSLLYGHEGSAPHVHTHGLFHFKAGKKVYTIAALCLLAAWGLSGIYLIKWDEAGIVQRFGAVIKAEVGPGIHYRFPAPFEKVGVIKKDNVQKISTGRQELLTGDTNLITINMAVHYKVADVAAYAFNVNNIDTLVRAGTMTAIRQIAGRETIDYLLTSGKEAVEEEAKKLLEQSLGANNSGVAIVAVKLTEAIPPDSVKSSFQDLASARQDQAIYINEAIGYRNTVIPKANADAYTQVQQAAAYKAEKIATAEGDALLFTERQAAYARSRQVNEFRLYMETMDRILPNVKKILLGSRVKINNAELWLLNNNTINGGTN
jgi:membrane protease subunit HflK